MSTENDISARAATDVRHLFDRADHLRRAVNLAGEEGDPVAELPSDAARTGDEPPDPRR